MSQAVALYETYVKDYPAQSDVPSVVWQTALLLDKNKDYASAAAHFATYAKNYASLYPAQSLCAEYKQSQALLHAGKVAEAKTVQSALVPHFQALKSEDKVKACPSEAVANAMFEAIEPEYQAYVAVPLSGSEDTMAKNLVRKLQAVDDLQKRYTQVLALGQGEYGIAALYRIGAVFQHMAQAIFATPCPKRLDEDQCGIYQAALQEKAFPLEEKAIEAYDKALAKAYELGLYNPWLVKTQEALTVYESGRFPDMKVFTLMSSTVPTAVSSLKDAPQTGGSNALGK